MIGSWLDAHNAVPNIRGTPGFVPGVFFLCAGILTASARSEIAADIIAKARINLGRGRRDRTLPAKFAY